jgi:DNA-binding transcriptional regulator YiaG
MTSTEFKALREVHNVSQAEFGRLLGFDGNDEAIARRVRRYELGETDIDGPLKRLLEIMAVVRLM